MARSDPDRTGTTALGPGPERGRVGSLPVVRDRAGVVSVVFGLVITLPVSFRRFCSRLGTLFGFVVNDLQDKIGRLNQLLEEDEQHYSTVHRMIGHEQSDGLPLKGNSGCVTLLRLHRGLGN